MGSAILVPRIIREVRLIKLNNSSGKVVAVSGTKGKPSSVVFSIEKHSPQNSTPSVPSSAVQPEELTSGTPNVPSSRRQ